VGWVFFSLLLSLSTLEHIGLLGNTLGTCENTVGNDGNTQNFHLHAPPPPNGNKVHKQCARSLFVNNYYILTLCSFKITIKKKFKPPNLATQQALKNHLLTNRQPYYVEHWKQWTIFSVSINLLQFSQTYQTILHI
jgi:hypothetical protein